MIRRFKPILAGLSALAIALAAAGITQAQDATPTPETQAPAGQAGSDLQIVVVMDISGSMGQQVFGTDLPKELQDIQDQMDAIEQSDAFTKLQNSQQAFQVDSPEVKAAAQTMADAQNAINQWLADNNYGANKGAAARKLADLAISFGCDDVFTSYRDAVNTASTSAALSKVQAACTSKNVTLTADQRTQLKATIAFLDDAGYKQKVADAQKAQLAYTTALTGPDFSKAISAMMSDPDIKKYIQLTIQRQQVARKYNVPTRLQLAQEATKTLVALSQLDQAANQRTSSIGLVTFSNSGYLVQPMTTDYDLVNKQVDSLKVEGETNIGEGMQAAIDELRAHGDPSKQSLIILMSDGQANIGQTGDQIGSQTPGDASGLNARICTVGFGNREQEVDSKLLNGLASDTGGKYLFAKTGQDLVGFFVGCRQDAVGGQLAQLNGTLKGTDPVDAGTYTVAEGTTETNLTLATLNGKAQVELVDPSGKVVDSSYAGAQIEQSDQVGLVVVHNPQSGQWTVRVRGVDVPDSGAFYNVIVTAKQTATPEPTGETTGATGGAQTPPGLPSFSLGSIGLVELAIICVCCLGLLVVLGVGVFLFLRRRKPAAPPVPPAPPAEPPAPPQV